MAYCDVLGLTESTVGHPSANCAGPDSSNPIDAV
jgi:hypothetical protein